MNLFDAEANEIYSREIDAGKRSSLSVLLTLVPEGVDVLDVGIGGGALGQWLAQDRGCLVDGVTISWQEAEHAAPHYRRIEVADLNTADLSDLFGGQRYSVIVCADVLEHIGRPTRVLDSCRELLADDGVLLLSVPNVAYIGLLGELLQGEFRYRIEGLLDHTHVRFFTRRSLLRMLEENGWHTDLVEPVTLDLTESEFQVAFDSLPPPVRRYLLAMPDNLTYQFVVRARAKVPGMSALGNSPLLEQPRAHALADAPHFSALVYLRGRDGYDEQRKLVAHGRIGDERQRIRFALPAQDHDLLGLRFDPADRPGFLHLHGLRLTSKTGASIWDWGGSTEALQRGIHQQVMFRTPWFAQDGSILLLTGEDPFFELPLEPEQLEACKAGGVLEVELGWPMSADYALFVDELARNQEKVDALERSLAQTQTVAEAAAAAREAERTVAGEVVRQLEQRLAVETEAARQLQQRFAAEAEAMRKFEQRSVVEAEATRQLQEERDALDGALEALGTEARQRQEEVAFLRIAVEQQRLAASALMHERESMKARLDRIENSTVFKMVARFVPALRARSRDVEASPARAGSAVTSRDLNHAGVRECIDIIVPVYKGLSETMACIESVLSGTPASPFRLVLINDASPEDEITAYLRQVRDRDTRVVLLENSTNLGFVGSVNRGLQHGDLHDVVLLNSDTEVAGDWLDRLRRAAYRERRIGTVTPFSNSATICSYPRFCADNDLPAGMGMAELDRLFAAENGGQVVDIPTAVGFCMFIRRDCLDAVGVFDFERFGRGYGEENDFCMRAAARGWRHVLALDTFVHHAGGVSFGPEKARRVEDAQEMLRQLHPDYATRVQQHIAEDPARAARRSVDVARVRASGLPSVLFVMHVGGGGTERHVRELASLLERRANAFVLRPNGAGETLLEWLHPDEEFRLGFRLDEQYRELVTTLQALGVGHVHYHHLLGLSPSVWGLPKALGVTHDFTAHDFYSICPQISLTDHKNRYCGEQGVAQCGDCLRRSPAPGRASIEVWRSGYQPLIESARFVFVPSADTANRLQRYFPSARYIQVPHPDMLEEVPVRPPAPWHEERPLRIVVIGALSAIKGADVLEAVAIESARRGNPVEFHLLGYAYRPLKTQPKARLTVHGPYEEQELPELLAWLQPDLAWFPALWPETYSYTLSACLNACLPIVAPEFGAFPERLHGRAWSWICPWDRSTPEWVEFFDRLRRENFLVGKGPDVAAKAAAMPSDFSYGRDYLHGLEVPLDRPRLSHEFLKLQQSGQRAERDGKRVRRALFGFAVRLRRAPGLRGVARRLPPRWKARARAWLSG